MGMALADTFPVAACTFREADAAFGSAGDAGPACLSHLVFHGPEDALTLTENAQPAILATSIAAWRVLTEKGLTPDYVAGHSLGEYSANVAAGTIGFQDAVSIVRQRGQLMQSAVPVGTGAMAAILGADVDVVAQACDESRGAEVVSPANINAPGQVVIAGHADAVRRASARARELGARKAIPLSVSAPFHCALMQSAQIELAPKLRALQTSRPRVPIVANVDGRPRTDAHAAVDALIQQVSAPVQWQACVEQLVALGVRCFVEVGPGAALSGMVKRIAKDATIVKFGTPEDFDEVLAACSN